MKAIIVELRNGYASVLSDDGCIRKVKDNNYELGQVISMTIIRNSILKKITMLTASAVAILILGVGTWAYASPYSYISLDVNPSIEFVLNRFDRVLKVKAGNEDGEDILQDIKPGKLKNKTIANAINETLSQIYELGYLSDDTEGGIVIAASNRNSKKADDLVKEIKEDVEEEIHKTYDTAAVEIFSVGMERVEDAKELGVTPGKLNLVEKMIESSDNPQSIVLEEWLDKPVKDIMKATKENKADEEESYSSTIEDDLLADNSKDKTVKEVVKEARLAAKEAEKAAKQAEKEVKKAAAKQADKEGQKAAEEAAKEAREAAKNARESAKEAEKAERKAKDAKRGKDYKSIKEAEKETKKAAKEAENAAKEAIKALEKAKSDDKSNELTNNKSKNNKNNKKDNKDLNKNNNKGNNNRSNRKDNDIDNDNEGNNKGNDKDNNNNVNNKGNNSGKGKGPKK